MSPYREFLGTETEIENKSFFERFVERCKLIWSKINFANIFDKFVMYVIVPIAVLFCTTSIGLICLSVRQNSIDELNGIKICGEMQYIKTNHVIKNLDEVECFISLSEGKKIIFVENKDKWILTGN